MTRSPFNALGVAMNRTKAEILSCFKSVARAKLDEIRTQIAKVAGEGAAKMIHAAVTFEIGEIRPLADFGQGWEKSI